MLAYSQEYFQTIPQKLISKHVFSELPQKILIFLW